MNIFLHIVTVAILGFVGWTLRAYLRETIEYKAARRTEIKRRLQVENKQEQALTTALAAEIDDNEKVKLVTKYADERHKRAMNYTIEDLYERYR